MKRRLLGPATAISFVCLIIITAAWVRSRGGAFGFERIEVQAARKWLCIESIGIDDGRVGYARADIVARDASPPLVDDRTEWAWVDARRGFEAFWLSILGEGGVAGFVWRTDTTGASRGVGQLTIRALPCWFLTAIVAVLPARWGWRRALRWRRERRARRSGCCCTTCVYDLRATRDRCPECGAVPEPTRGTDA